MDSEVAQNNADFFLSEVPNVRIGRDVKPVLPKATVKAEMLSVRLNDTSEKLILETLRQIHGQDFILNDASSYKDQKSNLGNKYWMDRGSLVVRGGTDNSTSNLEQSTEDKFKMFAVMRLESYGFHKTHCLEALNHCKGQVDIALEILFSKYYKVEDSLDNIEINEELLQQREDEKHALISIYENAFEEKIANQVWILTFKLNYITNLFTNVETKVKKVTANANKKPMCRNILKGNVCKYGNKCRFSHEIEKEEKPVNFEYLSPTEFELEIRFPKESKYPYEPPLIFLKTSAVLPEQTCLFICRRLFTEAREIAAHGMVSIFSVVELLNNEEEIVTYLKRNNEAFLNENEPLFSTDIKNNNSIEKPLPSHYRKGLTSKDNKPALTEQELLKEDKYLVSEMVRKRENPKYIKRIEQRRNLPAWARMNDILNTIHKSQVVVISGETGCGKSTQVPQFILDDWLLNYKGEHVEIVCTQPRRISAIGVAERVADERVENVGKTVGYQIRLESKVSASTRLSFCTTGILLRRLECEPLLPNVSHIIVDEVHERSEESDFLLLVLKKLLPLRPELKVILMSATLNANVFCNYFEDVPVLEIPGRTFPVKQYFLEEVLETIEYVMEENTQYTRNVKKIDDMFAEDIESSMILTAESMPKDTIRDENLTSVQLFGRYKEYSKLTCKNLYFMDHEKTNLDLIESLLYFIVTAEHEFPKEGSILIFLPGIAEITALHEQLNDHPEFTPRNGKFVLLPLHSTLTSEEQAAIFKKPKNGARKIVLSTNIAETSITIDDCVFVIDSGKMKEKRFDPNRNMESLDLVWESQANAQQRRGRAGRVMPGVCFHLMTGHRFRHHILKQPVPELHRVPLERLLLRIKILPQFERSTIHEVLEQCVEPPQTTNIDSAITRLQDVGAFDSHQQLTPLGLHLAALPVDVRIGKLALFGAIFCCVDSALTIAACLSYKSPFVAPFGKKDQANGKRKQFAVSNSDQLTILMAYNKWKESMSKSRQAGFVFAQENYLSSKTLQTLTEIKYQLLELLVSIGFVPIDLSKSSRPKSGQDPVAALTGAQLNMYGDNNRLLSALLCAALYPNVAKVLTPGKTFHVSLAGAVPRQPKPEELRFTTKTDGFVFLHPSSINASVGHFISPYLVYQEKIKTSRVFIKDCSMVPPLPLVMFSGFSLDIQIHNGCTILMLEDGWIMFQVDKHKVAEMLKILRCELFELLEEKIRDPCLNLLHHQNGKKIISTIVHIVTND